MASSALPTKNQLSIELDIQDHTTTSFTSSFWFLESPHSDELWEPPELEDVNLDDDELTKMLMAENNEMGLDLIGTTNKSQSPSERSDWDNILCLLVAEVPMNVPMVPMSPPPLQTPCNKNHVSPSSDESSYQEEYWQRTPTPATKTSHTLHHCPPVSTMNDVVDLFRGVLLHPKYFPFFRYISYLCEQPVTTQYGFHPYHLARKAIADCKKRCLRQARQYGDIPTHDNYQLHLCHEYLGNNNATDYFTELQAKLIERISSKIGRPMFNLFWNESQEPRLCVVPSPSTVPLAGPRLRLSTPYKQQSNWYKPDNVVPTPQKPQAYHGWNTYSPGVQTHLQTSPGVVRMMDVNENWRLKTPKRRSYPTADGRDDFESSAIADMEVRCNASYRMPIATPPPPEWAV